jgi:hypothetical protein
MVHEGLPSLRILSHIIVLTNFDIVFKDNYKARTNASKKFYQANPMLGNMPPNNPKIQRS